jgi:hypothetical protein
MSGPAADPRVCCHCDHYIVITVTLSLQSRFTLELRFKIMVNISIVFIAKVVLSWIGTYNLKRSKKCGVDYISAYIHV